LHVVSAPRQTAFERLTIADLLGTDKDGIRRSTALRARLITAGQQKLDAIDGRTWIDAEPRADAKEQGFQPAALPEFEGIAGWKKTARE
jgi:hypothetical protein